MTATRWLAVDCGDMGRNDSTTSATPRLSGRLDLAARAKGGGRLRLQGRADRSVRIATTDASTYQPEYQVTLLPDTVLRGSLPLSPLKREMHHAVQESIGANRATESEEEGYYPDS